MPEMTGFELFEGIRQQDANVPVVAITAMADATQRNRALMTGFADYFVKPILDIENFRKTVHLHLERQRKSP